MKLMVVDDDAISRKIVSLALSQSGHEVVEAADGSEAERLLRSDPVRLIVTDWEMPIMNGIQLCRNIRRQSTGPYTYVILLTSNNTTQDMIDALAAGADDFIAKPFNPEELIARVRAAERILRQESYEVTVFALAKLAESRDSDTGMHLERVQHYSAALATELSNHPNFCDVVDGEFIRLIYLTSPLHDIGKVGIPDDVLLKPGKLTKQEFQVMKGHTVIGATTLDTALTQFPGARFLEIGRDIAMSHHEKWNGSGYPQGLEGQQIPLAARIVALADVYDALTSRRIYKPAFAHDKSKQIIVDDKGTHFDPDIVDAFLRIEEQFQEIRVKFADSGLQEAASQPTFFPELPVVADSTSNSLG